MIWLYLWKFILSITLLTYSVLVIVVFFGGIRNIKDMLKELRS